MLRVSKATEEVTSNKRTRNVRWLACVDETTTSAKKKTWRTIVLFAIAKTKLGRVVAKRRIVVG